MFKLVWLRIKSKKHMGKQNKQQTIQNKTKMFKLFWPWAHGQTSLYIFVVLFVVLLLLVLLLLLVVVVVLFVLILLS